MKRAPRPLPERIRVKRTRRLATTNGVRVEGIVFSVGRNIAMTGEVRIPDRGVPFVHILMGVGLPEANLSLAELTDALQVAAARDLPELFSQPPRRDGRPNRNGVGPTHTRNDTNADSF